MADDRYSTKIQPSEGKGQGVFAIREIKKGTKVLGDRVVLKSVAPDDPWSPRKARQVLAAIRAVDDFIREQLAELEPAPMTKFEEDDALKALEVGKKELRWLQIYVANAFSAGVCLRGSRFNHSCLPNVGWTVNGTNNNINFYALRDVNLGEELLISYLDNTQDLRTRRKMLLPLGIRCSCDACASSITPFNEAKLAEIRRLRGRLVACHEIPAKSQRAIRALQDAKELIALLKDNSAFYEHLLFAYSCLASAARHCEDQDRLVYALEQARIVCITLGGRSHPLIPLLEDAIQKEEQLAID